MTNNIDSIIDKYYAGETNLEEESTLRAYLLSGQVDASHAHMIPLFQYFNDEQNITFDFQPDLSFTNQNSIKQEAPIVRNMWPKLISIAASFVILFAVAFNWFNSSETMYKEKYTLLEDQADQQRALEITLDALGFMGKKFDDGTKSLVHIKDLERTDIYKTNK